MSDLACVVSDTVGGGTMEEQLPLIVEDYNEAIQATVMALGGFKRVGAELWPDLSADAAGRRLSDCCNDSRREILSPSLLGLIRRIARMKGIHILAAFEMRQAGYADPVPQEPEDQRAALQRTFIECTKTMQGIASRLEQIDFMGKQSRGHG